MPTLSNPVFAWRRAARLAARLAAACLALAACSRDGATVSPTATASTAAAYSGPGVNIGPHDALLMVRTPSAPAGERGGTSLDVDAVLVKQNGKLKEKDEHLIWTSTDSSIVTVDFAAGTITAQDTGRAAIVVDYKDKSSDTLQVIVIPVPVVSVALAGLDSMSTDDTTQLTATPLDSAGEPLVGRLATWTSSAPSIASVSSTGEVVALAVGTTQLQADVEGVSATHALRVWLQPVASVEVSPASASVPQFRKLGFTAIPRDRRGKVLAGRSVAWTSNAPAIFYLRADGDSAAGRDVGAATVTATSEGVSGASAVTVTAPVEARALWITRFEFTTGTAVDFAKIATIMQKAASANFNVVYFQVRTAGDALYYSDLEPCSPRMCGSLGGTRPAQDPLAVALAEAAKYGIQVHAWINANTGWIAGSATACNQLFASTSTNWLKAHPEWSVSTKNFTTGVVTRTAELCSTQSEYVYMSPGVPEVRTQVARVAADLARRYGPLGLRGIHLDRIRYPSNQVSYDQPSQDAFKAATGAFPTSNAQASWLNARRGFVNQEVRDVHDSVAQVSPSMVISAAVWPGYQPRSGWSATWSYTDLFQDPQAWAQGGYLDVEVPMNYPATSTSTSWTVKAYCSNTDWTCVLDDHIARIERQSGRQVYVGVAAIRGWDEMQRQIDLAHDRSATGLSVYSYSLVDAIPNAWAQLAAGPFKHKATVPAMSWK